MHNHIAHHDMTLWALGANPETLRSQHNRNALYQRGSMSIQDSLVLDMADPKVFKRCLAREENFRNFERFFLSQINEIGYEQVMQKYLFDESEVANDILCRMYMGMSTEIPKAICIDIEQDMSTASYTSILLSSSNSLSFSQRDSHKLASIMMTGIRGISQKQKLWPLLPSKVLCHSAHALIWYMTIQ